MKGILKLCFIAIFGLTLSIACTAQKKEMKSSDKTDLSWEEVKEAYHDAMSSTFHPAEVGDFKPLRERHGDLVKSSKKWKMATIPENLSKDELKPLLEKLYVESSKISDLVKSGAKDEELKTAIFALHDVYHGLVGLCQDH